MVRWAPLCGVSAAESDVTAAGKLSGRLALSLVAAALSAAMQFPLLAAAPFQTLGSPALPCGAIFALQLLLFVALTRDFIPSLIIATQSFIATFGYVSLITAHFAGSVRLTAVYADAGSYYPEAICVPFVSLFVANIIGLVWRRNPAFFVCGGICLLGATVPFLGLDLRLSLFATAYFGVDLLFVLVVLAACKSIEKARNHG